MQCQQAMEQVIVCTRSFIEITAYGTSRYRLGRFESDATLTKAVQLPDGDIGILLIASKNLGRNDAWAQSSGLVFTSLPCVTFDQGVGQLYYSLLYVYVPKHQSTNEASRPNLKTIDVLEGSDLDFFPYSGAMPNISPANCVISASGIALVTQKTRTHELGSLSSETYFVPLSSSRWGRTPGTPVHLPSGPCTGWSALPTFSRDGESLAFLREENDRMLSISRTIFVVRHLSTKSTPLPKPISLLDKAGNVSDCIQTLYNGAQMARSSSS